MKKCVLLLISTLFLITSCGEESTSLSSTLDNTSKDEVTTSKSENQILLEEIIENYENFDIYSFSSIQTSRYGADVDVSGTNINVDEIFISNIMYDLSKFYDLYYFTSLSSYTNPTVSNYITSTDSCSLIDQNQIIRNGLDIDNPYIHESLRVITATGVNSNETEYMSSEEALSTIITQADYVYESYFIGSYDLSIFDDCSITSNSDGSLLISGSFEASGYEEDLVKTTIGLDLVFNSYGYLISAKGEGELAVGDGFIQVDLNNYYNIDIEHIDRIN